MAPHKNGVDENICRWDDCGAEFSDPDALYDHITSLHIGRKSAGTLSLECKWTGCNSKASKRDHLTSHARVHINLKPHVCEICSKAFKRPQDLKKHEKIHTEEHHVNHKHSKAVTVPSGAPREVSTAIDPITQNKSHDSHPFQPNQHHAVPVQQMQQQMGMPSAYGFASYPFGFPVFGQAAAGQSVDLSAFIAHQQQLNAQAVAGMHMGPMGYPTLPAYGAPHHAEPFPQVGQHPHQAQQAHAAAQAHAMQQMFAAQNAAMFPYGQAALPYMQPGAMPIHLAPSAPNADVRRASAPAPVAAPNNAPKPSSLYPSLPQALNGLGRPNAPAYTSVPVKTEDQPSPANSAHSSQGSYYPNSFHSSSVSPRVPALSPPSYSSPENLASPFSEQDSDSGSAKHSNAGRGKKRGFEEAAGQFFGDLKNKRFQDEDAVGVHLDALSQFLLSPESVAPSLTPARSKDGHSSSSSICSDYSTQAEVNQINELLLSLGQTIESKDLNEFLPAPQQQQQHVQPNAIPQPPYTTSMYPSLAQMDRQYARAPTGSTMYGHHITDPMRPGKSIAAPTLVNDLRAPQYTTVDRLHRAAPMSYRDQQQSFDDHEEDSVAARKSYSSSIRTTSFDEMEEEPNTLAPICASSSPSSGSNLFSGRASLTLPSIASIVPPHPTESTAPVTLPSIRALLDAVETTARNDASTSSPSPSPSASSSSSSSSSPASPPFRSALYPKAPVRSFSTDLKASTSTVRPGSSSGVVDRLTHRVHKLDVHPASIQDDEDEDASPLEVSSDEDEDSDHPSNSKRIRFESPEPMEQEDDDTSEGPRQQADAWAQANLIKQRRMFVLKTLIAHFNASYRAKLAAKASQTPSASATATAA
ncbi:hypothetical protein MVLG_01942 [Microbotryum lychnidis-dioicae p1A1 Lamole]|uniref:C2H2-type domain-containing protein n=1 Tax=Microbotryum lychnidis-dioicae (strain p1A1 Lamole / MvSl-1064) TaxID=683840 RepID=U5H3N1_USTV1|nr:hypothetical protein MVLG_01942 [Microbotryum lychnidis-dioicae p1A1 Lamole]|eukprot:KDE07848.1 hypothetical protein MVLG_01942 [Microbotryum lychnidis-dioicae p1A1 Lamole]